MLIIRQQDDAVYQCHRVLAKPLCAVGHHRALHAGFRFYKLPTALFVPCAVITHAAHHAAKRIQRFPLLALPQNQVNALSVYADIGFPHRKRRVRQIRRRGRRRRRYRGCRRNGGRRRGRRRAGRGRRQGNHVVTKKHGKGLTADFAVYLLQLVRTLKRAHSLLRLQAKLSVHLVRQIAQIIEPLLNKPNVVALRAAHQDAFAELNGVHFLLRDRRRRPRGVLSQNRRGKHCSRQSSRRNSIHLHVVLSSS